MSSPPCSLFGVHCKELFNCLREDVDLSQEHMHNEIVAFLSNIYGIRGQCLLCLVFFMTNPNFHYSKEIQQTNRIALNWLYTTEYRL